MAKEEGERARGARGRTVAREGEKLKHPRVQRAREDQKRQRREIERGVDRRVRGRDCRHFTVARICITIRDCRVYQSFSPPSA